MPSIRPLPTTHIWLYAAAVMLLLTAVGHAALVAIYGGPAVFVTVHIAIAFAAGLIGWRFEYDARLKRDDLQRDLDWFQKQFRDS